MSTPTTATISQSSLDRITSALACSILLTEALTLRQKTPTGAPEFKERVEDVWRKHADAVKALGDLEK